MIHSEEEERKHSRSVDNTKRKKKEMIVDDVEQNKRSLFNETQHRHSCINVPCIFLRIMWSFINSYSQ